MKFWRAEKKEVFCRPIFCSLSKISSSDVTEMGLFEFVELCPILGRYSSVFIWFSDGTCLKSNRLSFPLVSVGTDVCVINKSLNILATLSDFPFRGVPIGENGGGAFLA